MWTATTSKADAPNGEEIASSSSLTCVRDKPRNDIRMDSGFLCFVPFVCLWKFLIFRAPSFKLKKNKGIQKTRCVFLVFLAFRVFCSQFFHPWQLWVRFGLPCIESDSCLASHKYWASLVYHRGYSDFALSGGQTQMRVPHNSAMVKLARTATQKKTPVRKRGPFCLNYRVSSRRDYGSQQRGAAVPVNR